MDVEIIDELEHHTPEQEDDEDDPQDDDDEEDDELELQVGDEETEQRNDRREEDIIPESSQTGLSDLTKKSSALKASIRQHVESASQKISLKRKELKWKLIQASLNKNRAELDNLIAEATYRRNRMVKSASLARKYKLKYLKIAKAAKAAESCFKRVEVRLMDQEKRVADEKMQLTKLAVDCKKIGFQLYGPAYKLAEVGSHGDAGSRTATQTNNKTIASRKNNELGIKVIPSPLKPSTAKSEGDHLGDSNSGKTVEDLFQELADDRDRSRKGSKQT